MRFLIVLFFISIPVHLCAYVGPGLGTGFIATVLGIIAAILLSLFAVIWYPFKKLINIIKNKLSKNNIDG